MYALAEVVVERPEVVVSNLRVVDGSRPKGPGEIPGCDEKVLETIGAGRNGRTIARLGVGIMAFLGNIWCLQFPEDDRALGTLKNRLPELFGDDGLPRVLSGLLCLIRDARAGGTQLCGDGCSGVLTENNIWRGAQREAVEIGFFTKEGPLGYADPLINNEAARWWKELGYQDLTGTISFEPMECGEFTLTVMEDNQPRSLGQFCGSTEPKSGSYELVFPRWVKGLPKKGVLVRDTEHMERHGKWEALDRLPYLIVPRPYPKPPVMLCFGPNGEFNVKALIISLEGENLWSANDKLISVLKAMRWWRL